MSLCSHSKSLSTRSKGWKDGVTISAEERKQPVLWREGDKEARDCLLVGSANGMVKGHCSTTRATESDGGEAKSVCCIRQQGGKGLLHHLT